LPPLASTSADLIAGGSISTARSIRFEANCLADLLQPLVWRRMTNESIISDEARFQSVLMELGLGQHRVDKDPAPV